MMTFATRSKITFSSAFWNILLLTITLATFTLFTRFLLEKNLQSDVIIEAEEIISQHLTIDSGRIVYINSTSDLTLEQDLLTDRLSAKIFNKEKTAIGSFGVFSKIKFSANELKSIQLQATDACSSKSRKIVPYQELREATYTIVFYPILKSGECFGTVVVAADTTTLTQLLAILMQLAVAVLFIAIALNVIVGRGIAHIILSPLRAIVAKMKQLSIDKSPKTLSVPNTPETDELHQLITTFNAMAERVEEGSGKQRSFIVDASHELKTPIARAISELDVISLLTKKHESTEKIEKRILDAQNDLREIAAIIDTLLQATKLKQVDLHPCRLSLHTLIENEAKEIIASQGLTLENNATKEAIFADKTVLTLILKNCFINAIKYAKKSAPVTISTERIANTFTLTIKNEIEESINTKTIESYKLGFLILKNLCEISNYEFTSSATGKYFSITIGNLAAADSISQL